MRPARTPLVEEQATVCPKCGGELRFNSDRLGFGQTVEQCVNVLRCGHWRTLEGFSKLAHHAPAPRGDGPRPRQRVMRQRAERASPKAAALLAAIYERIPRSADAPRTAPELAELCGVTPLTVKRALRKLEARGALQMRLRHGGQRGRPPLEYWRVA